MRTLALFALAAAAPLAGCVAHPASRSVGDPGHPPATLSPPVDDELSPERAQIAQRFLGIELTDQHGKRVRLFEDLVKDHVVVINFMFTTCTGSCPRNTASLVELQKRMGDGVRFVSITLDPEVDDPGTLTTYAEAHGVGPGWSFLTGDKDEIEALRKSLGFYDPDPVVDADKTQHAGIVLYGNERLIRWSHMPALSNTSVLVAALQRVIG